MLWDDRIGRRLKLKDLHTLQTIAEAGSMARAAKVLALSQPAISKAIADMEHVVGASLLERSSQGVELTESGRILVARGRVIFDEVREWLKDIEAVADPTKGDRSGRFGMRHRHARTHSSAFAPLDRREIHGEDAPPGRPALGPDRAPVGLRDPSADVQAQARSLGGPGGVGLRESLEDVGQALGPDSDPVVRDDQPGPAPLAPNLDGDRPALDAEDHRRELGRREAEALLDRRQAAGPGAGDDAGRGEDEGCGAARGIHAPGVPSRCMS